MRQTRTATDGHRPMAITGNRHTADNVTSTPAVGAERCRPPGHRRPSCDNITPVLRQLHWLPVRQRVVFKTAGLVHQSLVGLAPAYLADDCRLLSDVGRRPLRSNSNDMRKLLVPRTHNKLGDKSFVGRRSSTVERPSTWTTAAGTYLRLLQGQSLKTHLFGDLSA